MAGLQSLQQCCGEWQGRYKLYLSADEPPEESDSTITLTSLLHDTFVRIDQTWVYDGNHQEGSLLVGCDIDTNRASLHWIDTFHTGRSVMAFTGTCDAGQAAVDVLGSFPVPPGPDWGWRILVTVKAVDQIEIEMFNIEPDEPEQLAVFAVYEPVKAA